MTYAKYVMSPLSLSFYFSCLCVLLLGGCETLTYTGPGRGINIDSMTAMQVSTDIKTEFARKPTAQFPVYLVVARVQESGYHSWSNRAYGYGNFGVVTTRDAETEEQFQKIQALPKVAQVGTVNRLLLPAKLETEKDLRQAAAKLQADIMLIYTIDTTLQTDERGGGLVKVASIGLMPPKKIHIFSTASAAFVDVRTGYVYGVAEGTSKFSRSTSGWGSEEAADRNRLKVETEALDKMIEGLEQTWANIIAQHARP